MKPVDELVNILLDFTPEQLQQFLNDPTTLLILRPGEEAESYLPEVS